ncbi:hypothetical protein [Sphingomonas sp. LHG3406-1]|uniref:hypothetical protein n=1 Tax=Sphingomonas sp. LHG3406-1 TaxID=2804617 RepID=UPI002639429E|nr:hypothetical protein [Sphingomonas sp. LHG3406-1]
MLKRAVTHPLVRRLTVREYVPLAAMIGTWAMLGLALGHADAIRLFAAYTFVQAVRNLCALEMTGTLIRRIGAPEAFAISRRRALRIDLLVALAGVLVALGLAAFLYWRGMTAAAVMVAVLAFGIPAKHPGGVLAAARDREAPWRLGAALTSIVGAALVWQFGGNWWEAAAALAARDYGGLLATLFFGRPRPDALEPDPEPLAFAEVAGRTESSARRRLTYRMAKSVLAGLLGPLGTLIARTGRGARMDAKVSRMIPRHRGGMFVLTAVATGIMAFFLFVAREPATLVFASAAARIAGTGGSALLWWNYGSSLGAEEDEDDD